VVVITAFISRFRKDRQMAKEIIGQSCFVEVFVNAPLEVCIQRDQKGLYRKALKGELNDFTGVGSPYEAPLNSRLTVSTTSQTPDEAVCQIINFLSSENLIP
jgi:adenylylsulfate kinase-like enzyme